MSHKKGPYQPQQVMPQALAKAIDDLGDWFVIDGQAVRCLLPYRPSRDVDLAVRAAKNLDELIAHLQGLGQLELIERSQDTVHLLYNGLRMSVFVLEDLAEFTEAQRLNRDGLLATKMHAILDRGRRRDFFDIYVLLQLEGLGIIEALAAMRRVYRQEINEALLLRALCYFDDAEREAPLPGEGPRDWQDVQDYFLRSVGELLVPPTRRLKIQSNIVDLHV